MVEEQITIRGKADMTEIETALNEAGLTLTQFNKTLETNFKVMTKSGQVVDKISTKNKDLANMFRKTNLQARRFKFEWLSIMFAGMALSRTFGGLIKTQMQLWGVTEGLSSMWTIIFLPLMEKITPVIWALIDAFENLPEGVQSAIGGLILFLAALGGIMLVAGQFMLFLGGLKLLAPALFGKLAVAAAGFLSVGLLPIIVAIAIITAVIVGIWLAWKSNFMNIRKNIASFIEGFKQMFSGIIQIVKGVLNIIKGIFTGDFELVKKGVIGVFKGIWNYLAGGWKAMGNLIVIIFKGIGKLVYNVFKVLIDGILWGINLLIKGYNKIVPKFLEINPIEFKMPSFQTGGLVAETGPALLHAGEKVIPKGRGGSGSGETIFSPTVYITAQINNEMDIRVLASKLNEYWARDFERIAQGRGI